MHYLITILLIIWQLPQTIVALIMFPFLGNKEKIAHRHHNICYKCSRMKGGISLGIFSFVSPASAARKESIAHEIDGHTKDSKLFGPFYLFVVGLPSLLNAIFHFTSCYYDFYTEKWANKHAGLKVTKQCFLNFDEQDI